MSDEQDDDLTLSRVRSSTLREATGRGWTAWLELLDTEGAPGLSHQELVAHLERAHGGCTTGWWRQALAVGYEQARGGRVVGQTRAAGFQLGVQRTLDVPLDRAWDLLVLRPDLWLGSGSPVLFEKGARYAVDGASGEVRVVRPHQRLRLTWQPAGWPAPAALQVTVSASGPERTAVHVHLEKLPDAQARAQLRTHWRKVLERLAAAQG